MIEVIDNFLPENEFQIMIDQFLNNSNLTWQFNTSRDRGYGDRLIRDEEEPFQFVHGLYRDFGPKSEYCQYIEPFLEKLNIRALLRVKVNLTTRSESIIEGDFHVDQFFDHKAAIFYLNTCDGYTLFENGEKVDSVANRMVLFDGSLKHTGTNCTDKQRRVVINFNYL